MESNYFLNLDDRASSSSKTIEMNDVKSIENNNHRKHDENGITERRMTIHNHEFYDPLYNSNQKISPNYVYIRDPKLRELVKKLIKVESEKEIYGMRESTHISYENYGLYFYKDQTELTHHLTNQSSHARANNTPNYNNKSYRSPRSNNKQREYKSERMFLPPLSYQKESTRSLQNNRSATSSNQIDEFHYQDPAGAKYVISEIRTSEPLNGETQNRAVEIPHEIDRIIQQDIIKNPFKTSERTYRVAINKNIISPGINPQVVRVVVKKLD